MRIEGLSHEHAPKGVRSLYAKFKQIFGHVIAPYMVMAHRPAILRAAAHMGKAMAQSHAAEEKFKTLACIRAAQMIGCPFWVDINSAVGRKLGVTDEQLEQLANFERSELFSSVEKAVLRYAERMTRTPVEVSDALFAELQGYFNSAQLVEITAALALENYRARFNRALEIPSEGFCELPANHPVRKLAVDGPLPKAPF